MDAINAYGNGASSGRSDGFFRWTVASAGATVAVVAVYAGGTPGPVLRGTVHGSSITAIVVLAALIAGGSWVLRTTSREVWRWALGVAAAFATAELAGSSLRLRDNLSLLSPRSADFPWALIHWLGVTWLAGCGLAALYQAIDRRTVESTGPAIDARARYGATLRLSGLLDSLRSADPRSRRRGVLVVMGVLVLSRMPYLIVWWPGILNFDSLRAYSYARGTVPWDTYDPVGHSMLVGIQQWLGTSLGLGDAGGVAIASITQLVTSTAAFTFMLARMAVWGLGARAWAASLAWCALLPVFGIFSVSIIKDVPFAAAFLVFITCVGELALGPVESARARWPWATLIVSGIVAIGMRNNGVHVVLFSLLLLLIPLRHLWRRVLIVLIATTVGYGLYVGPVYRVLDVGPGPGGMQYFVPIQQLARVAKYDRDSLSLEDRQFISGIFGGRDLAELTKHYVPQLSDPMWLSARETWASRSTSEFVKGWLRIATKYPRTAIEATLANTVGYWDPNAPSYDGMQLWSSNDARNIHLNIPSGAPTSGLKELVVTRSGFFPTRSYGSGLRGDGYRAIPVLGSAMSPGMVCWLWLIFAVPVIRRRNRIVLSVFVPPAVLLATFLAGPVSGGQRYSLGLFVALPLAAAAALLAHNPSAVSRNGHLDRAEQQQLQEAVR